MDNKILTVDGQLLVCKNSLISVPSNAGGSASQVIYDNIISGLAADNVQAAIDEVVSSIPSIEGLATEEFVNNSVQAVVPQILHFNDVVVPTSAWVEDTTEPDFPYKASIALEGVTANHFSCITFSSEDAMSGKFCPGQDPYGGGLYIYAKEILKVELVILNIVCIPLETGEISVRGISNVAGSAAISGEGGGNTGGEEAVAFAYIGVTYPAGATCTCSDGTTTLTTGEDTSGSFLFSVPNSGTWNIKAINDSSYKEDTVVIADTDSNSFFPKTLNFGKFSFSYTGNYTEYDDGNGNWRVKFLSSGTLTPYESIAIDVFCVGGGGGDGSNVGGGGGYTNTVKNISLTAGSTYEIVVGTGGSSGYTGHPSSAFGVESAGGRNGRYSKSGSVTYYYGGDGGSGGAGYYSYDGGSDGSNGTAASDSTSGTNKYYYTEGIGQGTTTREFGEVTGALYSYGGGANHTLNQCRPNYGDGGFSTKYSAAGTSGAVVIRNARG